MQVDPTRPVVPTPTSETTAGPGLDIRVHGSSVVYRPAVASDAAPIADLHADSWRRNYRGAYSDDFLDGDVVTDRLAVWTDRLEEPRPNQHTVVAEHDGALVGFAHTLLDDDPTWGALVDNLHVTNDLRGHGIGTRLMARAAEEVIRRAPSSGLYLWVLLQNTAAQAFYEARGGTCVGGKRGGPFPGGGTAPVLRYAWPSPAVLVAEQLS